MAKKLPGETKADGRDYAGFGPTDGVQSEASTSEAASLLGESFKSRNKDVNICGGNTARYTRDFDKA